MRFVVAVFLAVHGFAHLVGFVVPWRLANLEEAPYKTTLLNAKVNVGDRGIRAVGVLWLMGGVAFVVAGVGVALLAPWWRTLTLVTTLFSLVMSVAGLPESKLGIPINLVLLVFLLLGGALGWTRAFGLAG